jgi:hypothetical protein
MPRSPQPRRLLALLSLPTLLGLLSACSTPVAAPPAATTGAQPVAAAPALAPREALTGSRLPSKTTDRLLKSTDAAGAKEMDRDRAPNPGPKFN